MQVPQRLRVEPGGKDRGAGFQHLLSFACRFYLGQQLLVALGFLLQARQGILLRLQVGEDQLGRDRVDVVTG